MGYSYKHRVNYYETDAMGIVHHSNYVRWMEEARIFMMDMCGYLYLLVYLLYVHLLLEKE